MLDNFRLAKYGFALEALETLCLPPNKGSALRGGFGHTLKRIACLEGGRCQQHCKRGNACPYGYLFETSPPADSEVLSKNRDVPVPFVIEPPLEAQETYRPGEELNFHLILIGEAMAYLPYFMATFRELGHMGLGRGRGRYRLAAVTSLDPLSSREEDIYQATDEIVRDQVLEVRWPAVAKRAGQLPAEQISLEFLTATRLKHQGHWVEHGPPFHVLVRRLLDRASSLSYFHCGQRLEVDFRGLIERAEGVRAVEAETEWQDWSRFSGRQRQRVDMGGLVGRVTYAGELGEYLPLLALGELVHVGKGAVFGNGQFRIVEREG